MTHPTSSRRAGRRRGVGQTPRTVAAAASLAALALAVCAGCGASARSARESPSAPRGRPQAAAGESGAQAQAVRPAADTDPGEKAEPSKPSAQQPHVENVHTEDGVVIVTRYPQAQARDLGVAAFPGAREKESAVWVLEPPKGAKSVLAAGEFTSAATLQELEQFYRKELGSPEVRRVEGTLVVLSRDTGKQSVVVRLSRAKDAKLASIVIRRAVTGASVTIEPWVPPGGPQEGPERDKGRFAPPPQGTPISVH